MKLKYIYSTAAALFLGIFIISCNKDFKYKATYDNSNAASYYSYVKVVSATLGATRNYVYCPSFATPVTGATFAYGGTAPSGNAYFAVTPGASQIAIKDTLSTSTQQPLSVVNYLTPGSYYSLFTYDTITSIKYVWTQDAISIPSDTAARVRLGNFARAANVNIDVFSKVMNTNVFSNVSPASVTSFIPYTSKQTDTLFVRETGTTNLLFQLNGFVPDQKRFYTLVFRGRQDNLYGQTRTLSSFTNY